MNKIDSKRVIALIPSRYASSRFPGKPLVDICGKSMIQRVYDRVSQAVDQVWVATDDIRIADAVKAFGGNVVMTSEQHRSGTDRCYEAYCNIGSDADVVINVQGDEPFIEPSQIKMLADCFDDNTTRIATLVREFDASQGFEALFDPSLVKVTFDSTMHAMYFSRSIIPYVRNYKWQEWIEKCRFYTHVGMYGYRASTLAELTRLPQSRLELAESLEQLRWLEAGYPIKVAVTDCRNIGIDTPADLEQAVKMCRELENGCA